MALRLFLRNPAKRGGLKLRMIRQLVAVYNFHFVVGKIRFGKIRSLFEDHDAKAVPGKFFGQDAACRAAADDYEIYFVGRFILWLVEHPAPWLL